ncbi:unnamed protein product [Lymnaea stagnalis]|uniref:Peptidyl-tRNA hydrolase n=1 Tax=Lymnaea stagnalis TaxID=6523 RepID=A0AAV2H926_LYMST
MNMKNFIIRTIIRYSRVWASPTTSLTATESGTLDKSSKIKKFLAVTKHLFVNKTSTNKTETDSANVMEGTHRLRHAEARRIDNHFMIVGLGNHGFPNTRHSIGMKVIDSLAHRLSVKWEQNAGYITSTFVGQSKLTLFKPKALMNLNGPSVAKTAKLLRIAPSHMYLIHDELDRLPGKFHLKEGGSAGGHNGVLSCMNELKSKEMIRLRIGIGRPSSRLLVVPYVLGKFPAAEMAAVDSVIPEAIEHLLHHIEQRTALNISNLKINDNSCVELQKHTPEAGMKTKGKRALLKNNASEVTQPIQEQSKAQNLKIAEGDDDFHHTDSYNSTGKFEGDKIATTGTNDVISEISKTEDISRLGKDPVPDR